MKLNFLLHISYVGLAISYVGHAKPYVGLHDSHMELINSYRQTSIISRTDSQKLNVSRRVLQMSLLNPYIETSW